MKVPDFGSSGTGERKYLGFGYVGDLTWNTLHGQINLCISQFILLSAVERQAFDTDT